MFKILILILCAANGLRSFAVAEDADAPRAASSVASGILWLCLGVIALIV